MSDAESGKSGDGEEEQHGDDKSCSAFRPEQYEETIRSLEDQVRYRPDTKDTTPVVSKVVSPETFNV